MHRALFVVVLAAAAVLTAGPALAVYKPNFRASGVLFTGGPPCNRSGLDIEVFAYLPSLSDTRAQAVHDAYAPTKSGTLTIAGRKYKLRRYALMDSVRSDYVGWGFRTIKGVPRAAIGRKAVIRYPSAEGTVKVTSTKIAGNLCD